MKTLFFIFIFTLPSCGYEREGGKDNDFMYGGGLLEGEEIASRRDFGVEAPETSDLGADLDARLVDYNLYHDVYEEERVGGESMSPQAKFLQPRMF